MNSLRALVFALLLLPVSGWAQGVRMSADFLPLDVGKRWNYEVVNEAGEKLGKIEFAVEDYTIVAGTSFYVLTEFPFSPETGEPIRYLRYDRSERYFIRKVRDNESPLFLNDSATTEVIEADSTGAPQKFVLKTEKMALTFQRGVGIVEAKMQQAGSVVTAKLVIASANPTAAPVAVPTDKTSVVIPPPVIPNRRESPVAQVTPENPRVEVAATPTPDGFQFTLVVLNTSEKLLPFRFSSGQTYDFVIHDGVGREVWRWSNGNFFTQVVRNDSIRPSSKWQFEVMWNRKDNNDNPVPAGTYRLTAILTSSPLVQTSMGLTLR